MAEPHHSPEQASIEQEQPLVVHLLELRDRLVKVILSVLVVFLALFWFRNELYTLLAQPLLAHLPAGSSMIATEVASPFIAPVKLALWVSVFIAIPVILYHLWAFVAPGLYKNERRLILPLVISSTLLFFAGAAFAYFLVFPLIFKFFTLTAPEGVAVMTDITKYLGFVLNLFFAFGVAFETPVLVVLLVWAGVVTPQALAEKRRYIIVLAFIIAMLLTPPDVASQFLLAIPLCLLFELGLLVARLYVRPEQKEEEVEDFSNPEGGPSMAGRSFTTPAGTEPVGADNPPDNRGAS
jgi:sec-independent protein translocase protein TatC